jgi:hypothetical protein
VKRGGVFGDQLLRYRYQKIELLVQFVDSDIAVETVSGEEVFMLIY